MKTARGRLFLVFYGCFSFRDVLRLPGVWGAILCLLMVDAQATELPALVEQALVAEQLPANSLSVYVHAVEEPSPLLSYQVEVPRNPASAMKIVTTWAALNLLGPAYSWTTELVTESELKGGKLGGDIYLRGSGDPFLVTERLWHLLRNVRRHGVDTVSGDWVVDNSIFNVEARDSGAFDGKADRAYNVEPQGALLNFGVNEIRIERRSGEPRPLVGIEPPLKGLVVENRLEFAGRRCEGRLRLLLNVRDWSEPRIRLVGRFPTGCKRFSMLRVIASHEAYTRGLIGYVWDSVGGSLDGTIRFGRAPLRARILAQHESEPLALVSWRLNKFSNNVMSRQLLLTIGSQTSGKPGTVDKGRRAVKRWLASEGLDHPTLIIDNGSGLSRAARVRADTLGILLLHAYRSPLRPEFVASFPIAGIDGTLSNRFKNSKLAGRAHLKTGLLKDVRALAGYVHGRGGKHYVVVALQNHIDARGGGGMLVQDALLEWVGGLAKGG